MKLLSLIIYYGNQGCSLHFLARGKIGIFQSSLVKGVYTKAITFAIVHSFPHLKIISFFRRGKGRHKPHCSMLSYTFCL